MPGELNQVDPKLKDLSPEEKLLQEMWKVTDDKAKTSCPCISENDSK